MEKRKLAQEPITKLELAEWMRDHTTKKILARMDITVEHLKHQWYEGKYRETVSEDGVRTTGENDYWMGFANGVHEFIRIMTTEDMPKPPSENERG